MARKPYHEEEDPHDRWLISYADFITLLFALFVVMFAMSSPESEKFQEMSSSLNDVLTKDKSVSGASGRMVGGKDKRLSKKDLSSDHSLTADEINNQKALRLEKEKMNAIASQLELRLATMINQDKVRITHSDLTINIEINASILFAPAEAALASESKPILKSIADVLNGQTYLIQVEGYTDDHAIKSQQYPSNWELSSARSSSVVRLFVDAGIGGERMKVVGFADNYPVASNSTQEGRSRNRRVQIMIINEATTTNVVATITSKDGVMAVESKKSKIAKADNE